MDIDEIPLKYILTGLGILLIPIIILNFFALNSYQIIITLQILTAFAALFLAVLILQMYNKLLGLFVGVIKRIETKRDDKCN